MDQEKTAGDVSEKELSEKELSDKEINFSRLREKAKRLEAEAQESKKMAEELKRLREKDRLELEELKARQKELALEASLSDDDTDAPDEVVVSGKLKEKQKRLAEKQARIIAREISDTKKEFEVRLRQQEKDNEKKLKEAMAEQELNRLLSIYGADGVSAELESNEHLTTALQLMSDKTAQASYLSKHFEKKEKLKATLSGDNRGNGDPINTGIGAGITSGVQSVSGTLSLNKASLNNPDELKSFNDNVLRSMGLLKQK